MSPGEEESGGGGPPQEMPESVRRKVVWDWGDWERGLWALSLMEGLVEAHGRLERASGGLTASGSAFTEPRDQAGKGGGRKSRGWCSGAGEGLYRPERMEPSSGLDLGAKEEEGSLRNVLEEEKQNSV